MKFIFSTSKILFLIAFSVFFIGCSATKEVSSVENTKKKDTISDEKMFEFKYQFFEANRYFLEGNFDMAISLFNGCIKIDPSSSASYYKLASIYLYKKDLSTAEIYAEKAVFYSPSNVWYLYLAGNIYGQNNKISKAKDTFLKLIEINDNEVDYYLNLANVYIIANDISGAIGVYNTIEDKFGVSESISLQKSKLYMANNNKKEALNSLIKLSSAFPNQIEYRRFIADFKLQNNNIDGAIAEYQDILLLFPNDGFAHIGLAECYRKSGDFDLVFAELKLAFIADNVPSDVKFSMLLALIQNAGEDPKIQEASYSLTTVLYGLYPNDPDIATIYANFLLQKNQLKEAQFVLINVVSLRKDKYAVWEQLILLDNQFQSWDTMHIHATEALKYFPNQSFLYFFHGFSAFQLANYQAALKSFSFGVKLITNKDPLYMDFMTFLAESYHKTNDSANAYKMFDNILKEDPENVMVLNNYAYYLSEDNENLDKAEKMSKITITKEPENSTYLDTYAWILFRLKSYDKALEYITKAVKNDIEVSDVVLEHYGDILFFNNMKDEAIVQWIKAKELGIGSGLLDKKILNQTYFEK